MIKTEKNIGDKVGFFVEGVKKEGTVYAIDRKGTVFENSPSCDIFCERDNLLYKHVPYSDVM